MASGRDGASRHLDAFLDLLSPGARILELGCGGGRDAAAMLARGFAVDPTEGVAEIARQAEARLGCAVRVMRFDQLDAVEAYDGIWCHASLLHVPIGALPSTLSRIYRALRPRGRHFASYKSGGEAGRDRFGRYFNYPSPARLIALYREAASWRFIATSEYEGGGYDGRQGPWITVTTQK